MALKHRIAYVAYILGVITILVSAIYAIVAATPDTAHIVGRQALIGVLIGCLAFAPALIYLFSEKKLRGQS